MAQVPATTPAPGRPCEARRGDTDSAMVAKLPMNTMCKAAPRGAGSRPRPPPPEGARRSQIRRRWSRAPRVTATAELPR
jgi:hypothetical protein